MNRRGFISLLVGAAGAPLVPWRGLAEPSIFLPSRKLNYSKYFAGPDTWFPPSTFSNTLATSAQLSEYMLERMLRSLGKVGYAIRPTTLIVSPEVKRLIETNPNVRLAARLAGANV